MKPWLPPLLRCPSCPGESPLTLESPEPHDGEVTSGRLVCAAGHAFPVVDAIPDFVGGEGAAGGSAVYDALWDAHARQRYEGRAAEYAEKFQAFAGLPGPLETWFRGRTVLDAGCGEGRFTWLAAALGAARVVAVDSSREALQRARIATRGTSACEFVRADILNLPLRRVFDYAFSLGVLHHTPDSARGFRAVVGCLKPGGHVTVFVYRPWSLPWVVWPLRRLTRRMDPAR
ncbi:MAG: methyltransferase domain-containing protein, partial [Candidatus Rokubacteria bacterium]|nr:methyltransferase domain-containing protein [Candidatus Rokubacteria bacterium]